MSKSEINNMNISTKNDENDVKQLSNDHKRSVRKIGQIEYYHNEKFPKRTKKESNILTPEETINVKAQSEDKMRENNVERVTNIFKEYIKETLKNANLPIDNENSRVSAFVKSMEKSFSLKNKVYITTNNDYLVSSSDGKQTYTVQPKSVADTLKYTCNCGTNYKDSERTSCKHCGAIIFYNFDNYFNDYLNNKQNSTLQLYHLQNKFGKFDFEDLVKNDKMKITKPLKNFLVEEDKLVEKNDKNEKDNLVEKDEKIEEDKIDFFSFILKNKSYQTY